MPKGIGSAKRKGMSKAKLTNTLAEATVELMTKKDNCCPSYIEIAEAYYGSKRISEAAMEEIRKSLKRIKGRIEKVYQLSCCLVSEAFYDTYNRETPTTEAGRLKCIAWAQTTRSAGIYIVTDKKTDRLFQTFVEWRLKVAAGTAGASFDRMTREIDTGRMDSEDAQRLMSRSVKVIPASTRKKFADSVRKAIPDMSGHKKK